jgi:hypothetical protein
MMNWVNQNDQLSSKSFFDDKQINNSLWNQHEKKIVLSSSASNQDDELCHETKINYKIKKARIQIIFCRFCELREESHISYVTFQRDHISRLINHISQKKANNKSDYVQINEKINHRSDQIFCEKINYRINSIEFDNHCFHVDVKNHFKCVIFFIKRCNVKHWIKSLDFVNSQRVKKTFRISLSFRFF